MSDSFGGKIKDFFGFGEVDNYRDPYYGDSYREEHEGRDERDARSRDRDRDGRTDRTEDRYAPRGAGSSYRDYGASRAGSRYGESDTTRSAGATAKTSEPQVVRLSLSEYGQATELVEIIKTGDVVVFNLGGMEKTQAARVLDFATGLAKGVDAELKKLRGVRNFVLIPEGLTLEQSQLDQLVEDL